jgi:Tfp pilus assembly protein PilZ
MDKRKSDRIIKRLEIKFRTEAENTAITSDLSETGIFVTTNKGIEPGSVMNLRLNLPNSQELFLAGRVVRNIKSAPALAGNSKSGMGIQLVDPPLDYLNYVQSIRS